MTIGFIFTQENDNKKKNPSLNTNLSTGMVRYVFMYLDNKCLTVN